MYAKEILLFPTGGRSNYRIPTIVAANDGTIFAFCNERMDTLRDHADETHLVFTRKRPGGEWDPIIKLDGYPGWCCLIGSAVYDSVTDEVFCTVERRPVARNEFGDYTDEQIAEMEARAAEKAREMGIIPGEIIFSSKDGGDTWEQRPLNTVTRPFTTHDGRTINIAGMTHGSAAGIQLKHGAHKGRLLCPSRIFTNRYDNWDDAILACYNNSIYSDDHGKTWHASAPLQQGTGEGTLVELENGDILYNSRQMRRDGVRLTGISTDGGETYHDFGAADFLFEEKHIGCNASFLRVEKCDLPDIPDNAGSVTLFANPRSDVRENMTLCVSFDSGKTWPVTKTVWPKGCAYSCLTYDKTTKHFFLLYEKGGETARECYKQGIAVLEFDIEWLLQQ